MDLLRTSLGFVGAGLATAALLFASYIVASWLTRTEQTSIRVAGTIAVAYAGGIGWVLLSGTVGALNFGSTIAVAIGIAVLAGWWRGFELARATIDADLARTEAFFTSLRRSKLAWVLVPLLVVVLVRAARGFGSPPMATDALTYHLFRAGQWAQHGFFFTEAAPDAWGYYGWYPPQGDAPFALALVLGGGDALLGFVNVGIWVSLVVAAYAAARSLHTDRERAWLAAACVGSLPPVLAFFGASYVDIAVLATFLLAVTLIPRSAGMLALGLTALGLCAGIKHTGLPLLVLAGSWATVLGARRGWWRGLAIGWLAAFSLSAPGYLPGLVTHGNPLYPFGLDLGFVTLAGNEENELLQRGLLAPAELIEFRFADFLERLFWPRLKLGVQHLNFGPVAPLLMCLGLVGVVFGLRDPARRAQTIVLFAVVTLFVAQLGTEGATAHRTFAAPAVGRFLLVPCAALVLLAALVPSRTFEWIGSLSVLVGSLLGFPQGLGPAERVPALLAGVLVMASLAPMVFFTRRRRLLTSAVAGLFGLASIGAGLHFLRGSARYQVWSESVDAITFDPHPTDRRAALAWTIWQELDQSTGRRIAFAAGWDGRGHNWYRYPLLGSRLQNDVVYVPVTRDGSIVDYRMGDVLVPELDVGRWLTALKSREVEFLVVGAPRCPEGMWAEAMPSVFEPVVSGGPNVLYRIHHGRIADMTSPKAANSQTNRP